MFLQSQSVNTEQELFKIDWEVERMNLRCRLGNNCRGENWWCEKWKYKELWEQKRASTKVQRIPTFHSKSRKSESSQKGRNPKFSLCWFALSHVSKTGKNRNEQMKIRHWMKIKLLIFCKLSSWLLSVSLGLTLTEILSEF